jgi:YjbE family integral membrane protein
MLSALLVLASVIFLDVLLSGDNAVVVGMAANTLPKSQRTQAIAFGMVLAALTRIVLSLFAISLLQYRIISIVGGLGLFWVTYKLVKDIIAKDEAGEQQEASPKQGKSLLSIIWMIAIADISMSLDNVLAVAGIARNNPFMLVIGLMASIACVAFGAKLASRLMEKFHWLNWVGVGLIVVVAVELVIGVQPV